MLRTISEDVLPMIVTSNVIYKFVWCCDNSYVGGNTHKLGTRIRQPVPKYAMDLIRVQPMQKHVTRFTHRKAVASPSSAIKKHLLENDSCASEGILVIASR